MKQEIKSETTLEFRRKANASEWTIWMGMAYLDQYRPAVILAYQGRVIEAIEEAQRIRIAIHGDMKDYEFRCVTKSETVTTL